MSRSTPDAGASSRTERRTANIAQRTASDDAARGRWIVAATVLGSGAVFLEGSVVTVALPAIARDLGLGVAGLQWVMNGYLLPLSALMLLGGALGDRYRRSHVFAVGLVAFAITSLASALAPSFSVLLACRVLQGAAGALVVPNSLAILETTFHGEARGVAIGRWSAWSAISTAIGPLTGGWLVDVASWRWVFAIIAPVALGAAWVSTRHVRAAEAPVDGSRADAEHARSRTVDYLGAVLATVGLAGIVGALAAAPGSGPAAGAARTTAIGIGLVGIVAIAAFVVVERHAKWPLLPLEVFRSRQFTGANLTTFMIYGALGAMLFLLMLQLQNGLGYGALAAGASLLPVNALMLLLSPRAGRVAARIGARLPMAVGALVAAAGVALLTRVVPDASYVTVVLPAIIVFGVGLSIVVAPLTTAVLGAVEDRLAGVASGVNNAVARVAGLLATAALPAAAGLGHLQQLEGAVFTAGFVRAMWISAALCTLGGIIAFVTVGDTRVEHEVG